MQRAKLKFMNLFTTICVTRLRRDSGKERHYQASYSPPAGYALFQHSRAKRITRSLKENAAPPFGSRLVPGTMGVWPGTERKKADCRSRWKTFKPRLLARGKQKRLGRRIAAAAPAPTHPRIPGARGARGARRGRRRPGCCLRPPFLRPVDEHEASARSKDAPHSLQPGPRLCIWPLGEILCGHIPFGKRAGVGSLEASLRPVSTRLNPLLELQSWAFDASGTEGIRGIPWLDAGDCKPAEIALIMKNIHHGRAFIPSRYSAPSL